MLFLVDVDSGDTLVGYLVPDSITEPGLYSIRVKGEEIYRAQTDIVHPALVANRRHESGQCGFIVTENQLPGLSQLPELDVVDIVTGQTIYRRRPPEGLVHKRLFRLETHLLPLSGLDRSLESHFQLAFPHIDRVGYETITQILSQRSSSTLISGRIAYPTIDHLLQKSPHDTIVLLHDPFDELAERLLFLRLASKRPTQVLGERDNLVFAETLAFASEVDLSTDKALRQVFRSLDETVSLRLANPLVRQLASLDQGEAITGSSVSKALSVLAGFSVVGVRRRPDLFAEALTDLLGLQEHDITVAPPIPAAMELAERLRACPPVEDLLQYDLALFHIIADAFEKSSIESYS